MKILARIFYGFATLLGATGFLGCIAGLVSLWMIYSSIERGVDGIFARVDSSIDVVQQRIGQTQDRIQLSMIAGNEIRRSLSDQKSETATEDPKDETATSNQEGEVAASDQEVATATSDQQGATAATIELPLQLTQKAERLVYSLESVLEWLDTADASLTLIDQYEELLQLDPESAETQSLRSLSLEVSAIRELCRRALDFTERIATPSPEATVETSEAEIARALRMLARAFDVLNEIERRLQELPDIVENLRTEAKNIKTSIESKTFYAACTLTLFLAWMGSAQIALCCFGWKRLFYSRNALAVAEEPSPNQTAANASEA